MAYQKTTWKARQGENLNKFLKSKESENSVILNNAPDSITEQGTPISPENMNHLEEGVAGAHDLIAAETAERKQAISSEAQSRQSADNSLSGRIDSEGTNRANADTALQNAITSEAKNRQDADTEINSKIPNQASSSNQLADKAYVNSSITNLAARYITRSDGSPFPTRASLLSGPYYYQGSQVQSLQNDYASVTSDESHNNEQWRYTFDGVNWDDQYKVNSAPFTAAQQAAIDSAITAALTQKLNALPTAAQLTSSFAAKQNNLNRTVSINDNSTNSVTDTGGNLSIGVPITVTTPAASAAQATAGTFSPRSILQLIINNIKHLFDNKQNKLNRSITLSDDNTTDVVTDNGSSLTIGQNTTLTTPTPSNTNITAGKKTNRNILQQFANNINYLLAQQINNGSLVKRYMHSYNIRAGYGASYPASLGLIFSFMSKSSTKATNLQELVNILKADYLQDILTRSFVVLPASGWYKNGGSGTAVR